MSVQIPVFQDKSADFTQSIDLDNVTVTIRLVWNSRVEYWFMSISTDSSNIEGIKLVEDYLLLDQHKALLPDIPGDFIIEKISDEIGEPNLTYDNFGIHWALFYYDANEAEIWRIINGIE